jgi:hypothetical protein
MLFSDISGLLNLGQRSPQRPRAGSADVVMVDVLMLDGLMSDALMLDGANPDG